MTLSSCVDVRVQPAVEVLAGVPGAEKRDPRGAAPSSAAGETDQTHGQGEETEEEGRGGGRGEQESSGKDTLMEVQDDGRGENFFFLNRRSWRGHSLVTVRKRRRVMKRGEVRKGG